MPALPEQVHDSLEPGEIVFALLRLAEPPGELAHADDVDARGLHQLDVALPGGFGVLARCRRMGKPTVPDGNQRRNTYCPFALRPFPYSKEKPTLVQLKSGPAYRFVACDGRLAGSPSCGPLWFLWNGSIPPGGSRGVCSSRGTAGCPARRSASESSPDVILNILHVALPSALLGPKVH